MQNPKVSSSNLNSRFARWLRLMQPMFLVATICLVLLACQFSGIAQAPNVPLLNPGPTNTLSLQSSSSSLRLPEDAETQIWEELRLGVREEWLKNFRNGTIEVIETGTPSAKLRQAGVTKVYCVHLRIEVQVEEGVWKPGVGSGLAAARGNLWSLEGGTRDAWLENSCSLSTFIEANMPEPLKTPKPVSIRTPTRVPTSLPTPTRAR